MARSADGPGSVSIAPRLTRSGGRSFTFCATIFLVAALAVAIYRFTTPMDRGWWLVAYLSLVGGVAQLMLGPGLLAIARQRGAPVPDARAQLPRLIFWNSGTVMVAVSNLTGAPANVVSGSLLLLAALAFFNSDLRAVSAAASDAATWWVRGYRFLLVFLAVSVAVGTILAFRGR